MKTIFFELNEVPKRLFDFYSDAKPNSSFAYLRQYGNLFETVTGDIGHLSPWITWPSLHRGVSNVDHKISDLGQDLRSVNIDFPPIWELLASNNVSVGMFGSLQSYPLPRNLDNYKFYVPDTFAAGPECFPKKLDTFQKFNLSMVQRNGKNVSTGLVMKEAMAFLKAAPGLGLRGKTIGSLAKQLVRERVNKKRVVRRRTSQVEIAFDFFLKQLAETKPDVSFFFTNHVASSMHRYWPTVFPKDYEEGKFEEEWLKDWSEEIPHAVRVANKQLAELIKFVQRNTGYRLIVLSSMGQAAVQNQKIVKTQVLITDVGKLLSYIGVTHDQWEPRLAMAPIVVIKIKNDQLRSKLRQLDDIDINGAKLNCTELETGEVRFDIMCFNVDKLRISNKNGTVVNPLDIGLSNVHLQDAAGSYAYHVPEGILINYCAADHNVKKNHPWTQISALDVAPSVLQSFGIASPSYMKGDKATVFS